MNAETLRSSILQKAMEGKLLPQLSEEVDVDQIGDTPDEIPFEIPNKWKWIQIKNLVTKASQKIPDKKFEYVDVSSIDSEHLVIANTKKIDAKEAPSRARKILFPGMVIYSTVRPYLLKTCVIGKEFRNRELIRSTAFASMTCKDSLLFNKYFLYCLSSPFFVSHVKGIQKGVAYPAVSEKDFFSSFVPIPPVGEQKRIVKKLEELLPLVEEYGRDQEQLEKINKDFPVQMEKSLLREAVSGKLVPQFYDEPVVQQIGDAPEETLFAIPEKWKWVRSTELITLVRGVTFPGSAKQVSKIDNSYVRCLTTGSVQEEYNSGSDVFIPSSYIKKGKQKLKKGDVIISTANSRDLVGKSILWNGLDDTFGGFLTVARGESKLILPDYLHLVFRFLFLSGFLKTLATQTTNIANLSNKTLETLFFPLPPLEEQERIVEKLDKLMLEVQKLK